MAIPPPGGFNIPLISPDVLFARKPARPRSPLDDIMQTAIENEFALGRQRESEQFGRETSVQIEGMQERAQAVANFTDLLNKGVIQAVPDGADGDQFSGLERLTPPEGFEAGGRQYVRFRDVLRKMPLKQYAGREVAPGTTLGDVMDPGTDQISPALAKGVAKGDVKKIEALVNSLPAGAGGALRRSGLAFLAAAKSDPFFSAAEEEDVINQGLDIKSMDQYEDSVRVYAGLERDKRQAYASAKLSLARGFQVLEQSPNGGPVNRRDLTPVELDAMAYEQAGLGDTLSPALRETVNRLYGTSGAVRMVPRREAPQLREQIAENMAAVGNPNTKEFRQFTNWISGLVLGKDGKVTNEAVAAKIRATEGSVNYDTIDKWAASAASAPYRGAWTLYNNALMTRSIVNEQNALGVDFPFSTDRVMDAYGELDPAFNDTNAPPKRDNLHGGAGVTGAAADSLYTQHDNAYTAQRGALLETLSRADPMMLREAQRGMMAGDPKTIADSLRATARDIRANGKAMRQEAKAEGLAAWFESTAGYFESNPTSAQIWRDSIFNPTLRGLQQRK